MVTEVNLDSIKKVFNGLRTVHDVKFAITEDGVEGSLTVSVPIGTVSDTDLIMTSREHLHGVFLCLAEAMKRPGLEINSEPAIGEEAASQAMRSDDPSEVAAERRREEIAAAKLLIAVGFFANGSVSGADSLPLARPDSEGEADAERFKDEVTEIVMRSMPDGRGGASKFPNLHIARWLLCGSGFQENGEILSRIKTAATLINDKDADPQACQRLWTELMRNAR